MNKHPLSEATIFQVVSHPCSLVFRPTLSRGKRLWYTWLFLAHAKSAVGQANEIVPHHVKHSRKQKWARNHASINVCSNQYCWLGTTKNHSIVTRPFSWWEGGVWTWDYDPWSM